MILTKTMPSETVEAGRIAWLVEQIEASEKARDFQWSLADHFKISSPEHKSSNLAAVAHDEYRDRCRAELRAILGVDPYRLANAIGAGR